MPRCYPIDAAEEARREFEKTERDHGRTARATDRCYLTIDEINDILEFAGVEVLEGVATIGDLIEAIPDDVFRALLGGTLHDRSSRGKPRGRGRTSERAI